MQQKNGKYPSAEFSFYVRKDELQDYLNTKELAYERKFKEANKELKQLFREKNDKGKGKKEALKYLCLLLKTIINSKINLSLISIHL